LSICIASVCALTAARADTVAVLPFSNDSSLAGLDWISESIAETIDQALEAQGMLVLGREDRQEAYRRLSIRPNAQLTHASVLKVAEALDATDVVCGTFEFTPPPAGAPKDARGALHLTAWTVNMKRMRRGPEFLESGPLDELAALQSHLAWQILHYLAPETTPSAEDFLKERPPVRLDAMENYTRGLLASGPEQKHRYFTQAVRLDPRLSEAGFELGRLYWKQKEYRLAAQWFAKVAWPATRHLEASFLLGLCRYYLADYAAAQEAFANVAGAVPLNEVFNNLGAAQSRRNLPEAVESFQKALEGDPADPDYHFNLGVALWKRGNFEDAARSFRATLDRNPEDAQATLMLGRCLKRAAPTPADLKAGLERVKLNYEEGPWRQLKAAMEAGKTKQER
ncbi:MAG TPA: tetratricopeptide repeat protein, partial [Bryobacteraceae bacterium]